MCVNRDLLYLQFLTHTNANPKRLKCVYPRFQVFYRIFCQNQKESNSSWCILDQLSTYSFASRFQSSTNHVLLSFSNVYICKENTAAIQKIFTYYNYSSACVNSVELGTIAATKASLFVVRKFFNMNSMHGTHIFCLQMSSLSVFFRKPLNHFFTECNSLT